MRHNKETFDRSVSDQFLRLSALGCFAYAAYIALRYASQPLLDEYFFRQTQTALTSYWMMKDGFSFAYETPVAGAPWSIPFEFPIYQYIVALIAKATAWPLSAVGRGVSFIFLTICLLPVRAIVRRLQLDENVFFVFAILIFSSPVYLYWGRSFMIETAGLFFVISAIYYFLPIVQGAASRLEVTLFVVLISLGILQKATTALPVLAILSVVFMCQTLGSAFSRSSVVASRSGMIATQAMLAALYFGIPLITGILWTLFTDRVKVHNPLGAQLTSGALGFWNWGTLSQRFSAKLYVDVIWVRIFVQNLAGLLGVCALLLVFLVRRDRRIRAVVGISIGLAFFPLFLFSNLHIIHTYYQTANLIFLIFALAVSVVYLLRRRGAGGPPLLVVCILLAASNYYWFSSFYLGVAETSFSRVNTRELAIADVLKRELPVTKSFVAFGSDWNSALAYFSERKSFTVPPFVSEYEKKSANPENYMAYSDLGAVTLCPTLSRPTLTSLLSWSAKQDHWKVGEVNGCYVMSPERAPVLEAMQESVVQCEGALDGLVLLPAQDRRTLFAVGWLRETRDAPGSQVYISLQKTGEKPIYLEGLRVWRPDINAAFTEPVGAYHGFSRVLDAESLHGTYSVGVARRTADGLERCSFHKEIKLP